MVNLIKANFYKLFRMKSFYICGALAIINAVLNILLLNAQFASFGDISPAVFGYNGLRAGLYSLTSGVLFCTIFISLFIPQDFSFGTIKNIIASGKDRISIYFSQWIMGLFVTLLYTLIPAISAFILGNCLWGYGEVSRSDYLDALRTSALVILAVFAVQTVFMMVGFLVRRSGATIAISWIAAIGIESFIIPMADHLVLKYLKVQNFSFMKYYAQSYINQFLSLNLAKETLITGIIVCVSTILISSAIGIVSFIRRDVK